MRVAVTGATGFVGGHVVRVLRERGLEPVAIDARPLARDARACDDALRGVGALVHLAGMAHVAARSDAALDEEYRVANEVLAERAAEAAARVGARRVVHMSTVVVFGDRHPRRSSLRPEDAPAPVGPYGTSKARAEERVREVTARTGIDHAILRPPLVYGPGVRANFLAMMRWVDRGVPLPLGAVRNRRSLVSVDVLADVVVRCVAHATPLGATLHVTEDDDVSTPDLLRDLAVALARPARLVSVPTSALRLAARVVGRPRVYDQLCGTLCLDVTDTRRVLAWRPACRRREALARTAAWYRGGARP
jgi:UDP-glucose 4-epimerase